MSDRQIEREMQRMDDIVRRAGHRFHKGSAQVFQNEQLTSVDWSNPLDELIEREEAALRDAALCSMQVLPSEGLELPEWVRERVKREVFEQFQQYENSLLEWIFAAGPHPLQVLRRLFAYTKMKRASLLWNMGFRALGKLLKESHENFRLLTVALFGDLPAGWKKGEEAKRRMAASAIGNDNRRGGKKARLG